MQSIEHAGRVLALIHRADDWKPGLDFLTEDGAFVQAGTWCYDKGRRLDAHTHNVFERTALRTQELAFVRTGAMRVDFYDEAGVPLGSTELRAGDLVILLEGGHGYEILEDGTQVLEVKNGPFLGVEQDKVRF